MKKMMSCLLGALAVFTLSMSKVEATIKLTQFENLSSLSFQETFEDGTPYQAMLESNGEVIIEKGATIVSSDGKYKLVLEDAARSGYHRPHWKFHVWLESEEGFPFLNQNRILYAVVFYDGAGEVQLHLNPEGKLEVTGGYDVADVLYPWAKGTIGRGNPYHEIKGTKTDDNGVKYFDNQGFVAYPYNRYVDEESQINQSGETDSQTPKPIRRPPRRFGF